MLGIEPRHIPLAGQHALTRELRADLRRFEAMAVGGLAKGHDLQQRLERRASQRYRPVGEIALGNTLMRRHDVGHAFGKDIQVLQFRAQHALGENGVRMQEDTTEIDCRKARRHAVAETARQNGFTLVLEIGHTFQRPQRNQVFGAAFLRTHAREDFRHQQTDVMIDAHIRPDMAGTRHPTVVSRQGERNKRRIEIDDGRQRVERPLGQRPFGTRASRRWRLAGHRADELDEEFRQLHVMQRVIGTERADAFFRGIVAASGSHHMHRRHQRFVDRLLAEQAHGQIRRCRLLRIGDVRTQLQIARVLRRLAIDHARVCRRNEIARRCTLRRFGSAGDQTLHRLGVGGKTDDILDQILGVGPAQRLEVGNEGIRFGDIGFGLMVVTAMNRIVRTLEQSVFAVLDELARQAAGFSGNDTGGRHDAGRDVVLGLNLAGRMKIMAQTEDPPRTVFFETDPQGVGHQLVAIQAQGIAQTAIDGVDRIMTAPIAAPFRLVIALDDEHQFLDVLRDGIQPYIVVIAVIIARRQQLDDAAHRTRIAENQAMVDAVLLRIAKTLGKIARQDFLDGIHVFVEVRRVHHTRQDGV